MRGLVTVANPGKVELTLTLTLTVDEWKTIADRMPSTEWPHWQLVSCIRDAVSKTVGHIEPVQEVGG